MNEGSTPPSMGDSWKNFWASDIPMAKRIRIAMRNNLIKVRTRKNCCGNYGEPGC